MMNNLTNGYTPLGSTDRGHRAAHTAGDRASTLVPYAETTPSSDRRAVPLAQRAACRLPTPTTDTAGQRVMVNDRDGRRESLGNGRCPI